MYYRLIYTVSPQKEKVGDSITNGIKPLAIGQRLSCDLELPESDDYEPQVFASILPYEGADGWYIVRRTDCFDIAVNGLEMTIAQHLNHGDELSFSDGQHTTVLRFEVFDDGEYDARRGIVYRKHKVSSRLLTVTALLSLLAMGIAGYALYFKDRADLRNINLDTYKQAVYHIVADSVYLLYNVGTDGQRRDSVIESVALPEVVAGTCFLTSDTLFVTARHCVEPWINDDEWDGVSFKSKMSPEVRLATLAETMNRQQGTNRYSVKAHCVISRGLERYDCYSTDFFMNKTRDMVLRLGTSNQEIYWRTIFPMAHKRDMELGDFAYMKAGEGIIDGDVVSMATMKELKDFNKQKGSHDVVVIGFPLNDNNTDDIVVTVFGNSQPMEFDENGEALKGCIQMSAPINPGNSGGPILANINGKVKVVGIVSKADGRAGQGMFWAVPVTEVLNMHANGDQVEEDSRIFRR